MSDALQAALSVAASGLHAQSKRLRVVSENLANAQSTAAAPGGEPYARKVISFAQTIDDIANVHALNCLIKSRNHLSCTANELDRLASVI